MPTVTHKVCKIADCGLITIPGSKFCDYHYHVKYRPNTEYIPMPDTTSVGCAREGCIQTALPDSPFCAFHFPVEKSADADVPAEDMWAHRAVGMRCQSCMWYVPKAGATKAFGRCRKHAPTMNGFPAVFSDDWCGDHRLDETKL